MTCWLVSAGPSCSNVMVYNAIHKINHYQVDDIVCFTNIYLRDSDLSGSLALLTV